MFRRASSLYPCAASIWLRRLSSSGCSGIGASSSTRCESGPGVAPLSARSRCLAARPAAAESISTHRLAVTCEGPGRGVKTVDEEEHLDPPAGSHLRLCVHKELAILSGNAEARGAMLAEDHLGHLRHIGEGLPY